MTKKKAELARKAANALRMRLSRAAARDAAAESHKLELEQAAWEAENLEYILEELMTEANQENTERDFVKEVEAREHDAAYERAVAESNREQNWPKTDAPTVAHTFEKRRSWWQRFKKWLG